MIKPFDRLAEAVEAREAARSAMTLPDLLAFLKASQATLHVAPNGDVTLCTCPNKETKPVVTSRRHGEIEQAVNDHAKKVFA